MNSRTDIKNFILKIENVLPVDEWKIDSIHVWPIIRIKLFLLLLAQIEPSLKKDKRKEKPTPKISSNRIVNWVQTHNKTKIFKAKQKLNKLKKVDVLFSCASIYRAQYNNKSYEKFADPIIESIQNKSLIVEHSLKHLYDLDKIYKKNHVHFLYDYFNYTLLTEERRNRLKQPKIFELQGYSDFLELLGSQSILKNKLEQFSTESLKKMINRFHDFKDVYNEILDRTQPKIVFSICYYSFPVFVLNYLANKRNIKTIEIQHGPQSDVHLSYASWTKVPKDGFNIMPQVFWNWDEYSYKVINEWSKNTIHECFVASNPWVKFFRKKDPIKKNIILYSLQNLQFEHLFPDYIVNSIKTTNDYEWWLRLHPRQLEYLDDLTSFLRSKGIEDKVNIKEASNLPLPEVLNGTKVHITNFSGCVLEAADFGVPSILIDERGFDAFKDLVNEKKAFYTNSPEEFIKQLSQFLSSEHKKSQKEEVINYQALIDKYS